MNIIFIKGVQKEVKYGFISIYSLLAEIIRFELIIMESKSIVLPITPSTHKMGNQPKPVP